MRLFIAAELPDQIMEALAETQAALRATVSGRYAPPDTLHVTLAFLGEVDGGRIDAAIAALDQGSAHHAAFECEIGQLGSFGRKESATLWQGFRDEEPFADLAADIRDELSAVGIEYDDKPFRAHITLMRRADLSQGVLPQPAPSRGLVERLALFSSKLTQDGPIYTPVHTVELGHWG